MPLSFTGDQMETIAGVSIRATDHTGKRVVVIASQEAVQDHEIADVQNAASEKYDRGEVEADGTVRVRNADLT
jgi:hypothetical protein